MTQQPANPAAEPAAAEAEYRLAVRMAAIAGTFCLIVGAMLVADYRHRQAKDPLESQSFKDLKKGLAANPKDEVLKVRIRDLDQKLRREYFRQRSFAMLGGAMLAVGAIIAAIAARWAATLRRRLPSPVSVAVPQDPEIRMKRYARWSVAALAAALAVGMISMSVAIRTPLAAIEAEAASPATVVQANIAQSATTAAPAAEAAYPSDEEVRANWPRFRGPEGRGMSAEKNIPTAWNVEEGKAIVWKTAVPMPGHNSPIAWGDRIFVSGADAKTRKVFCFDAAAGKMLWQTEVPPTPKSPTSPIKVYNDTGFAASTMATDGRRAYAIFATGDLAAVDFTGKIVWVQSLGVPKSSYSHASSLAMYRNLLIVQVDQGEGARDKLSKIMAFDGATGKTVWTAERPVPNSWSTPIVVRHGDRDLLVATGDPWVIAYQPADGKEIWRVKCLKQDVGPSPTYAAGMVFAVSQFPQLSAIRPEGEGDITAKAIAWSGEDGLPDTCSPLATDEFVLLLGDGVLTAYDTKTGKKLWEKDLDGSFKASPTAVGKLVYVFNDEGKAWVLEPSRSGCKEVGTGELGENCSASPAFRNGRMYVRGEKQLFCIGNP